MKDIYLIYGSDYKLIKRKLDEIKGDIKDVVTYDLSNDKIDNLLDDALCISMFEGKKLIIGENALFLTSIPSNINHNIEYLSNYLNDDNHENIVVLTVLEEKLDERKKIVKQFKEKANVIHVDKIDEKKLPEFIINEFKEKGYKIDYKTTNYFLDYVGNDINVILNEINKMILYKDYDTKITIDDVNNISSRAFKDNIFDLLDGIMKKNYKKIFECMNDLKILKEEPIKIISMLGKQITFIYRVKILSDRYNSNEEISRVLNCHPYRVKLAKECDYMTYELEDLIKKLHNLDYEIKSGKKDKILGFDDFLMRL